MPTTTMDERETRLDWLEERITKRGWCRQVRVDHERKWKVSRATAFTDAKKVMERLRADHDVPTREERRASWLARSAEVQEQVRVALERETKKGAKANLADIARLARTHDRLMNSEARVEGLLAPQQVEISGRGGGPIEVSHPSPEEYAAIAEELLGTGDSASAKGE